MQKNHVFKSGLVFDLKEKLLRKFEKLHEIVTIGMTVNIYR